MQRCRELLERDRAIRRQQEEELRLSVSSIQWEIFRRQTQINQSINEKLY